MSSSGGIAMQSFTDFMAATGPAVITDPGKLTNLATDFRDFFWMRLFEGDKFGKKRVQGGTQIEFHAIFDDNGSYTHYQPGAVQVYRNPQRIVKGSLPWRFDRAHMAWNEAEFDLNGERSSAMKFGGSDAVFQIFVNLKKEKETLMWMSVANGIETQLFARPDFATMEGAGTDTVEAPGQNSLFVYVNEQTNGLFPGWTTIEGISPTAASTKGRWKPQVVGYSDITNGTPTNHIAALDEAFLSVGFKQPRMLSEYFNDPKLGSQMILTSKKGRVLFSASLLSQQDRFVAGAQDPTYANPQMHGIPVEYVPSLDTVAIYDDGASGFTTEALAAGAVQKKGPRFYLVNGGHMHPVFHDVNYFKRDEPMKDVNVPDTWSQIVKVWWNLACTDLRRNAVVRPTVNLVYP